MVSIPILLCAILIALFIGYIIPKKKIDKINEDIQEKNKEIQKQYNEIQEQFAQERIRQKEEINQWEISRNKKFIDWKNRENELSSKVSSLEAELQEKKKSIEDIQGNAQVIENQVYNIATINIEQREKELRDQYKKLESELLTHYTDLANEEMDNFISRSEDLDNKILTKENELNELKKKVDSIIESNKRIELEKEQKDFYRLQLSDLDIEEIKKIRSIEPYLRKKEPLNKVIWKVYYEKPYTDLIGRVIGNKKKTGIYKITNLKNGMCYIGQSVDIAERWKQHIKRGIGADPVTQNKLYPAMLEQGIENFTFELLEECPVTQLTEREKFYIDFYKAQEFGYSIKKG